MTTMDSALARVRRIGIGTWLGFAVLAVAGAAFGAWFEWQYWHPSSQLAYVFAAPVVLGVGVVLFLLRSLPTLVRFGTVALVAGFAAGALLGPSRPATVYRNAEVVLRLTSPIVAEATGTGGCVRTESGQLLDVSGDQDLRVGEGLDEVIVGFSISKGDMYGNPRGRADELDLLVLWSPAVIPADVEDVGESRMVSDTTSDLEADFEGLEGSVNFSGLVLDRPESGTGPRLIDVAGTIEWTCDA